MLGQPPFIGSQTKTILDLEIARRHELVRIGMVAIGLHNDRIHKHEVEVAGHLAEIERLEAILASGVPERVPA